MRLLMITILVVVATAAQIANAYPTQLEALYELDPAFEEQLMGRLYKSYLMKDKRSPSIGLSLAEYMAPPGSQDQFHFIPPTGRK